MFALKKKTSQKTNNKINNNATHIRPTSGHESPIWGVATAGQNAVWSLQLSSKVLTFSDKQVFRCKSNGN